MKFTFLIDEFDCLDVKSSKKYEVISWVLSDNNHDYTIDLILNVMENIKTQEGDWEMSFNKSFLNINSQRVICGDLYDEKSTYSLSLEIFTRLLLKWKSFVNSGERKKEIYLNCTPSAQVGHINLIA